MNSVAEYSSWICQGTVLEINHKLLIAVLLFSIVTMPGHKNPSKEFRKNPYRSL